jgi:hypothetical protein
MHFLTWVGFSLIGYVPNTLYIIPVITQDISVRISYLQIAILDNAVMITNKTETTGDTKKTEENIKLVFLITNMVLAQFAQKPELLHFSLGRQYTRPWRSKG